MIAFLGWFEALAFLTSVSVTETSLPRPYFSWRSRCYWHPSTVFVTYFWFLFFSNGEIKRATVSHFFKRFGHGMSWRTKTGPPLANFLSETTLSCFSRVFVYPLPCSSLLKGKSSSSISWCSWQLRRLKGRVTWDTTECIGVILNCVCPELGFPIAVLDLKVLVLPTLDKFSVPCYLVFGICLEHLT